MKRGFLNTTKVKQVVSTQAPPAQLGDDNQALPSPSYPVASEDKSKADTPGDECTKDLKGKESEKNFSDYKKDQRIVYHLGLDTEAPGPGVLSTNQLIEDSPSDMLNYEPHELICTTQPAVPIDATREQYPDGWTECLITGLMKQTVLQTPSFCQPLSQPVHTSYRVGAASAPNGPTSKPLPGLYATKKLEMGDLILSERPVLIVPAMMRVGEIFSELLSQLDNHDQATVVSNQWQETLETVFGRLSKEDQEEFWKLRDIRQRNGKKSIDGIVKANGFAILGLADPGLEDNDGAYSGVCLVLSQLNHSCRPNVERYWDMTSFSMQLRAMRKISNDEELTVSYINQLEPFVVRQKNLKLFDIVCTCQSCKKPKIGDRRRTQFLKGNLTTDDFLHWIKDASLSDDHVIKRALVQISLLEDDGLENSPYYSDNLMMIMLCYVALGDDEKAMRWGKKLGKWELCKYGPKDVEDYDRPQRYTKHQLWKLKVNARNNHWATANAMKEKMKQG
ncbi:hypothetical protein C8J55DRAFT_505731 [Lentinula edodes]|uniref:SET domain-containing protein n=1 Tax=Lentinula lateritia TaxID=40482 RepID=A0A9W9ASX6_9AGAR|nr:hypothetical protein C8J55DRAFT_505731 [Lentinula edodes]